MDICTANNQFAVDVLKEIGGSALGQNVVFAPFSIISALSMVYLGARDRTAAQMGKALHFTDVMNIHSSCKNLLHELVKNEGDYVLINANKLFGEKSFQFLPTFMKDMKNSYDADLEQLDFLNDPETSRKYINDWISQQTQGKIQELLPNESISDNTALVLANTLYFAANWTKPFNQERTNEAPFTRVLNEQVIVNMMHITSYFNVKYIKNPGIKVLELPYGVSQDFTMVIFLPDDNTVLKKIEQEMSLENVNTWMNNKEMKMQNVLVHLPKFRIKKTFSMKKILSSFGMADAFYQTRANFSGMTKGRNIFLSDVYHQTFIEINEKGTEAASGTASVMSVRTFPGAEFKVDHPFYFFIKNKMSGCIVLCGVVYNP